MTVLTKPIVFDGSESSVQLIEDLIGQIAPWMTIFCVEDTLYLGQQSFEVGTSFNVVLPDEINIIHPPRVEKIKLEFKWSDVR